MSGYLVGGFTLSGDFIMSSVANVARAVLQINNARQVLALVKERPCINKGGTTRQRGTIIGYAELTAVEKMLKDATECLQRDAAQLELEKTNKVGNVVRDLEDKDGWRVEWCDRLTSPVFNSKGAAEAYLDSLFRGRKPEYSADSSGIAADDDHNRSL